MQIGVEPGDVALQPVVDVAGASEEMELGGIDDQLGGDAEGAQGLVHLLAADDGDVEVVLAAHEEGGRFDAVGVQERIGNFYPGIYGFPRWAEFVGVLKNVLVGAVKGQRVGQAGAADGGFETRVCRDGVVGEHAAVAPTADAETFGVGYAAGNGEIYGCEQVGDFLVAPIGKDAAGEFGAASAAAAIVYGEDNVAVRGEELPLKF